MKKILTFILFLITLITISSCFSSSNKSGVSSVNKSDTSIGREQAEEILRCFNEEDIEGLKSMFCK